MGWIIGFAILWFVLGRHRRRMWRRRLHAGFVYPGGILHAPREEWGAWGRSMHRRTLDAGRSPSSGGGMRRPASAVLPESEFEALKRRYVSGDLSDEQYEAELDVLFRTPEGRRQV